MKEYPQYEKALSLLKTGDLQSALELYKAALSTYPENPNVHHDIGVCYLHMKSFSKALEAMDLSVQLQPEYSYRYSSRAYVKAAMKDAEGAMADYKKAIELDPLDAVAQNNLGMLEEQMGYAAEAQKRFETADELSKVLDDNQIVPESTITPGPKIKDAEAIPNTRGEIAKVLSTKSGLSEFLRYIGNGFKLNDSDKKV